MIERRRFIHLAGAAAVATAAGLNVGPGLASAATAPKAATTPPVVIAGSRRYRINGSSRIDVSLDGGKTWKRHTNFGPTNRVAKLTVDRSKRLNAQMSYAGRSFNLRLGPDLKKWLTVA